MKQRINELIAQYRIMLVKNTEGSVSYRNGIAYALENVIDDLTALEKNL